MGYGGEEEKEDGNEGGEGENDEEFTFFQLVDILNTKLEPGMLAQNRALISEINEYQVIEINENQLISL